MPHMHQATNASACFSSSCCRATRAVPLDERNGEGFALQTECTLASHHVSRQAIVVSTTTARTATARTATARTATARTVTTRTGIDLTRIIHTARTRIDLTATARP